MATKKGAKKVETTEAAPILAYKGFGMDWKCRNYQFAVGKTYEHKGDVKACASGFHSCENPFDVWGYYNLCESKFALVEVGGAISRHDEDSKIASAVITIKAELKLPEFIKAAVEYVINLCKVSVDAGASGELFDGGRDYARIGSSGYSARIGSSGHSARIGSSGHSAQIGSSGDSAQIGSSGDSARIGSSGDSARIGSSGDYARIGSSGHSARIGSSGHSARIGSSGDSAQIGSSGDSARIGSSGDSARIGSSGDYARIEASGENSIVAAAGTISAVKAGNGGCICAPWHDGKRTRFAVAYVGEDGIKADTWYSVERGKFVEVKS